MLPREFLRGSRDSTTEDVPGGLVPLSAGGGGGRRRRSRRPRVYRLHVQAAAGSEEMLG